MRANLGAFWSKIKCASDSRRTGYEQRINVSDSNKEFAHEKKFSKMAPRMTSKNNVKFPYLLIFYIMKRSLTVSLPMMKRCVYRINFGYRRYPATSDHITNMNSRKQFPRVFPSMAPSFLKEHSFSGGAL